MHLLLSTYFVAFCCLSLVLVRLDARNEKKEKKGPPSEYRIFKETITVEDKKSSGKGLQEESYQRIHLRKGENKTATKLSEVVEKQHGVRVNRFGAPGTFSSLSIRGASPNQSGVYINGIAINNPLGGPVNLESLSLTGAFSTAEFYRSYTPLHLSGSHIGGAVDLIPRSLGDQKIRCFINSGVTSLQGGSVGAGLQLPWTLQAIKLEASDNRYIYYDDNGTPLLNKEDDQFRQRENEDYKLLSYTGLYSFQFARQKIKALVDVLAKERGIAGSVWCITRESTFARISSSG